MTMAFTTEDEHGCESVILYGIKHLHKMFPDRG